MKRKMEAEKEVRGELQNKVVEQRIVNKYGDGVAWCRGPLIGKGSFGSVYLATLKKNKKRFKYSYLPPTMAVKSAEVSVSGSIQKEREVFSNVKGSPYVIGCFGEETTFGENGEMVYNLLLEYGSGGTLADVIKKSGGGNGLPESDVKHYTLSILLGLTHIHGSGYVHCDLKPDNILLVPKGGNGCGTGAFVAKIGDLGLAKRVNRSMKRKLDDRPDLRGTPVYWSPEAVIDGVQEPPCDVWALGLIVLEMLTGKLQLNPDDIFNPRIPSEISKKGKDFLKSCLVKKPMYRLTAEMLLHHPFIEGLIMDDNEGGVVEEVSDIDGISSFLLLSETDDQFSCSSFSDGWCSSDEGYFTYWSEEEAEVMNDDEVVSSFARGGGKFQVQERNDVVTSSTIGAEFDRVIKKPRQASTQVPSNTRQQYPIPFTIPAGV